MKIDVFNDDINRFCLTVMDPTDASYALFEELGLQGGGYTWEGIAEVLIGREMPKLRERLDIGAEADNMYVYCEDRRALEALGKSLDRVAHDMHELRSILENESNDIE
ncbi:MAG: hypothetical protein ACI8RZ_005456 [Myxococcota bacterium]|jgi:hypothetical protein